MKRLIVVWMVVLAVAVVAAIPALAQGVPDALDTSVSGNNTPLMDEGSEALSNGPQPDVAPPPETPRESTPSLDPSLPETSLPVVPSSNVSPPNIGKQKSGDESEANEAIEDQGVRSDPAREIGKQEVDSHQTEREADEEQEVEDREVEIDGIGKVGIGKAGIDKAGAEKAGDPKQETEQDADSGDADQSVDVINTGDNVNLCLAVLQTANTGNAQNAQGVVQDVSEADEVELEGGSSITITPQLIVDCRQIIYQIVTGQQPGAGSGDRDAILRGAALRGVGNVPGFGQLGIGTNRAALKVAGTSSAGLSKAAARSSLPRTGGGALLGLGAGVVLVTGGLSVRRIFR
jgi:hypothetical protein